MSKKYYIRISSIKDFRRDDKVEQKIPIDCNIETEKVKVINWYKSI